MSITLKERVTSRAFTNEGGTLEYISYGSGSESDVLAAIAASVNAASWVTAISYVIGNYVKSGGLIYVCKLGHTSGATNEPGVGASWATYWTLVGTIIPITFLTFKISSYEVEPIGDPTVSLFWIVTITYDTDGDNSPPETGETVTSFDIQINTKKILQAYGYQDGASASATTCRLYRSAGNKDIDAPHNNFAIGQDDMGNVTGADVDTGSFIINETHYVDNTYVTGTYIRNLASMLTDTPINSDTITIGGVAWNPGEVRFIGASGSKRGTSDAADWEINYRYSIRTNYIPVIGDISVGITVNGWSWVDVNYRFEPWIVGGIEKGIRKVPVGAYVYRLWLPASFSVVLYPWITP